MAITSPRLGGYLPEAASCTGSPPLHHRTTANGRQWQDRDISDTTSVSSSSSSLSSSASSYDSEDSELLELQAAEREWEENARQLQLAVSVLILPTLGKWLGRRWSYWLYAQYIKVGWTWTLFIPETWFKHAAT